MQSILRIFLLTCVPGGDYRRSASLGADAGCWDLSISEPSVSKFCSPAALRGECSPATSAVVLLSEILGGCAAPWEAR